MRFIYLSKTSEPEYETKESANNSFKEYLLGEDKFYITEGKIDKKKFDVGEDIFFLRAEKEFGYYTYKIVAYCRSSSRVEEANDGGDYPYYFKINSDNLKIFIHEIDVKYFQNFIDDPNNNISSVNFTGSINNNKFTGSQSWIYFNKQDSAKIMEWFRKVIIEENIQMLSNI